LPAVTCNFYEAFFIDVTIALATIIITLVAVATWFQLSSLPFGVIVAVVTIAAIVAIVAVIAVALFAPVTIGLAAIIIALAVVATTVLVIAAALVPS
jgi:hypothetical protein